MRTSSPVLCFLISCLLLPLAFAGPGTHRFEAGHSNYGEDLKNKQHIQEHINALAKDGQAPKVEDKDMVYYLFVVHDKNADGHLDGHELRAAFTDFEEGDEDPTKFISLEEVTEMVDHVLEEDDIDGDGLISWDEYLQSQLYHGQT